MCYDEAQKSELETSSRRVKKLERAVSRPLRLHSITAILLNKKSKLPYWLRDILKIKLVDFAWNRRFSIYPARACLFSGKPGYSFFNLPDFFYPGRLFWSIVGSARVNPGKQERGGAQNKSQNRQVFFSRYRAANDVLHDQKAYNGRKQRKRLELKVPCAPKWLTLDRIYINT